MKAPCTRACCLSQELDSGNAGIRGLQAAVAALQAAAGGSGGGNSSSKQAPPPRQQQQPPKQQQQQQADPVDPYAAFAEEVAGSMPPHAPGPVGWLCGRLELFILRLMVTSFRVQAWGEGASVYFRRACAALVRPGAVRRHCPLAHPRA
jgi:hypothetical protein